MLYVSPRGKTTVPPLLQLSKAARIWGTSSRPLPSGFTVQVLDGSATRGRSGDRDRGLDAMAHAKGAKETKRKRRFKADMVLCGSGKATCLRHDDPASLDLYIIMVLFVGT